MMKQKNNRPMNFQDQLDLCEHENHKIVDSFDITTTDYEIKVDDGVKISGRLYVPGNQKNLPLIYHIHGGAFETGNVEMWDTIVRYFAQKPQCAIFSTNYRLTPEVTFPIPIEDCMAVYRWLRNNRESMGVSLNQIGFLGDSAGGNLVNALVMYMIDNGEQKLLPDKLFTLYYWLVFNGITDSLKTNALKGCIGSDDFAMQGFLAITDNADAKKVFSPYITQLSYDKYEQFLPAYISTAE
ncbi:acetyl esterase [Enterococcus sp. DIV0724b]|uniref:alpha/beta hydrolase n=1 Tax=Enterococcus sp. DIV0724b TaxID=2774694 RepID=UPI003D2FAFDE